ncbi:hypothetical protein ACP3W2_28485, partial [Salmonella enterica]
MDDTRRSERIVLHIPLPPAVSEFAEKSQILKDSSIFDEVEEAYEQIKEYGAPKAIIRWANVDR